MYFYRYKKMITKKLPVFKGLHTHSKMILPIKNDNLQNIERKLYWEARKRKTSWRKEGEILGVVKNQL